MIRHLRNYLSAGVVSALVGLMTFPILTRTLSVEQYGMLGLITATLTLFVAVGKLGLQHAVIRFFAQIKEANSHYSTEQMYSTVMAVFLLLAVLTSVVWLVAGRLLAPLWMSHPGMPALFTVAAGIVFLRLLASGIVNFMRADQQSGVVAQITSLNRLGFLAMLIAAVLLLDLDPWKALVCMLLGELVSFAYACWRWRDQPSLRLSGMAPGLATELIRYGLPLMMLESLGLILRLSDRYMIEGLMGVEPLGQYSASYNLTAYLDLIILVALAQAVRPAYTHMWEKAGREPVQAFLARGLRLYFLIGIPFVAAFSLTSPHLLMMLAGEKYAAGTVIIPLVATSFLLEGSMHFLAAGLYLNKDTTTLLKWGGITAVINLTLNFFMIPRFGISGAAAVTIISYLVFMLGVHQAAFKRLSFEVRVGQALLVAVVSLLVGWALHGLDGSNHLYSFLIKGTLATVFLTAIVVLLDSEVRQMALRPFRQRRLDTGERGS